MKLLTFLALGILSNRHAAARRANEAQIREWDYESTAKELVQSQWEEFKLTYNKHYETEAEELSRKKIFIENSIRISEANQRFAQGLVHNQQKINHLADLTHAEHRKLTNCLLDYESYVASNATEKYTTFIPPANVKLPDAVDWREQGAVTPVKNQGSECGSCYSFSATGALEGQRFRKDDKLVSLSEQNIVDCSWSYGNQGCEGGLPARAFEYIEDNGGIDTEESYPYEAREGECRYNPANKGATDSGVQVIEEGSEDALKAAVATVGPIAVGIDANHSSFDYYKPGRVYYEPECSSSDLDHAVLVVGYGTDPEDPNPDYWIVKNSHGETWGDNGYIKMARNKNNHCGIATFPVYPLV